eukprot:1131857-Prorocentrum_minimum.AAC.5
MSSCSISKTELVTHGSTLQQLQGTSWVMDNERRNYDHGGETTSAHTRPLWSHVSLSNYTRNSYSKTYRKPTSL